jgi:hypothetical protein
MAKSRRLEDICCGKHFMVDLQGNTYCKLAVEFDRAVRCPYLAEQYDHNRLRRCNYDNFSEILLDYEGTKQ